MHQVNMTDSHNVNQWPVLFDNGYGCFDLKDKKNIALTSKCLYNAILQTERYQQSRTVNIFLEFLAFQKAINYQEMQKLKEFNACRNLFDVQAAKLRKMVEISILLHNLSDPFILDLKNSLKNDRQSEIFGRIITNLKTNLEIDVEVITALESLKSQLDEIRSPRYIGMKSEVKEFAIKPYINIINSLLVNGRFDKASTLLKQQKFLFKVEDLTPEFHNYTLINTPFLDKFEKQIAMRDVFESVFQDFRASSISRKINILTTQVNSSYQEDISSYWSRSSLYQKDIIAFLKTAINEFSREGDTAKSIILSAIISEMSLPNLNDLEKEVVVREHEKISDSNSIDSARADLSKKTLKILLKMPTSLLTSSKETVY